MADIPLLSVLYFGNDWFAENRTSSHHIARRLGVRMPLLYIETPGLRAPQASGRDARKLLRKLGKTLELPKSIGPHMWHMTVPQIPFRKLPLVASINRWLGIRLVKRAIRHLRLEHPISWFVVPHPGPMAGRLGEEFIVYYCIDDYAAFPNLDPAAVEKMDRDLTVRADQVFVASQKLVEPKRALNPSTVLSPHGVDAELFGRASNPGLDPVPEVGGLKPPVIGFWGSIEAWIDLDLVLFLAKARPHWTFLMIGRLAVDVGALANMDNVIFPGPQKYNDLPRWAGAFSVAIIPYRHNRQVMNANPLKLREYLATGKPVVSVSTPEVDRFAEYVSIADDPQQFLEAIEAALERDSPEARQARQQAVAGMTWDARVEEIWQTVENRIHGRKSLFH